MVKKETDKYCEDILIFLLVYEDRIRFNKLYTQLTEKMNYKISRPTLAEHLKHLVKKKYVIRKKEGKQNVTYRYNDRYFTRLKETRKIEKEVSRLLSEKIENFNSLPMDNQLETCIDNMILRNLRQLNVEIRNGLYKGNEFENKIEIMFINSQVNRFYERRLLENSLKDKEYGDKLMRMIEDTIENCMKELYINYEEGTKKTELATF